MRNMQTHRTISPFSMQRQQGFTLLELIVGMVIGLLIIAAALGTLMLTRSTSATTSDLTQLQQQAAYALRVIGLQIRQGGAYEPVESGNTSEAITFADYANVSILVNNDTDDRLTILTQTPNAEFLRRDCLGNDVSTSELTSIFDLNNGSLRCGNSADTLQPVIGGVTDFQVRYRNYSVNAAGQYSFGISDTPATTTDTTGVAAIEICLELEGAERMPESQATYTNCEGEDDAEMGDRIRRVFRNVYSLRVRGA
ncbi:prepilin-type N-terminal cleavage/methylation domain-containing protein [Corticibacter populi]|uniref:Prepilin-type N-terminal cleavage/methylation domain-containing protein n=1 Tax=Corticibacter populi TaxID=1550736 RepID=A0A3M6QPL3_9BURK|nr:prepilin-type N-terminal cleavage/methylation domain-containing protein [Corticibacter populi]RMX04986.1 prepilin-type N-terminal cleavage/methylation domain-containing protein [Corticibacter populi]RZS33583.1 type IV pilus assembly protein PilW [Corticibacter populi]